MSNWSQFDNINAQQLNKQVEELNKPKQDGDFPELPNGKYEVSLDSLELKPTKEKGYPMVAAKFTILHGEFKKFKVFVNQVLLMGNDSDKYRVHTANTFLKSLDSGISIQFTSVADYEVMVEKVFEAVKENGLEYLLEISDSKPSKKDGRIFKQYKIVEVFDGEEKPF